MRQRGPLGLPDLEALGVKPKRFPAIRAHSHRHPLIPRDGLSATVTDLPYSQTIAKFDQVISWQAAIVNPMSDELTRDVRVHGRNVRLRGSFVNRVITYRTRHDLGVHSTSWGDSMIAALEAFIREHEYTACI